MTKKVCVITRQLMSFRPMPTKVIEIPEDIDDADHFCKECLNDTKEEFSKTLIEYSSAMWYYDILYVNKSFIF